MAAETSYDRAELERTAEVLQTIDGNGYPNKLYLLFEARGGIRTSIVDENSHLRPDHAAALKAAGLIHETDAEYRLTALGDVIITHVESIHGTLSKMTIDARDDLLDFLKLSGWDDDLTRHWELFTDSIILSSAPLSKYSRVLQIAQAVREVVRYVRVPDEYDHRIRTTNGLDPADVEFVYTPRARRRITDSDQLFTQSKTHEDLGVTSQFLAIDAPTPGYNLTLLQLDAAAASELRGPTDWLTSLDLSDWLVIIEVRPAPDDTGMLLVSDSDAVREWAIGSEEAVYHQYRAHAEADAWNDPTGILGEDLVDQ